MSPEALPVGRCPTHRESKADPNVYLTMPAGKTQGA